MNIFSYIAGSDEYGARAVLNKYGFDIENVYSPDDLGVCLQQLVGEVGEPAMRDILVLHPDKDVISETTSSVLPTADTLPAAKKSGCGCGCGGKKKALAEAQPQQGFASGFKESHIFIFAGALLLAAAIIAKK